MSGEGFKVAIALIIGFVAISCVSLIMVAKSLISVTDLGDLFQALGVLAGMLGVQAIIVAWVQTRGQTSASQIVESAPLASSYISNDSSAGKPE